MLKKQKIFNKIDTLLDDSIKFTQELIRIPSVNPPGNEIKIADHIKRYLKKFGISSQFLGNKDRPNLIFTIGDNNAKSLLLNAHLDTVPVTGKWETDPFGGIIKGDRLYGRGAADDKAGVSIAVHVARTLLNMDLPCKLIVALTVDEETGASSEIGANLVVEEGIKATQGIVIEPISDRISIGHRGHIWLKIITEGIPAHTSGIEKNGVNAVLKMAKILQALDGLKLPVSNTAAFKGVSTGIEPGTVISGGGIVNTVPARCETISCVRPLPGQNKKEVIDIFRNCLEKLRAKDPQLKYRIEILKFAPGCEINPDVEIVKCLAKNARTVLGKNLPIKGVNVCCDAHFFVDAGIPAICGFGPKCANMHSADEWVSIKSIKDTIEILIGTAIDFFWGTKGGNRSKKGKSNRKKRMEGLLKRG